MTTLASVALATLATADGERVWMHSLQRNTLYRTSRYDGDIRFAAGILRAPARRRTSQEGCDTADVRDLVRVSPPS
jgi:hypothetical protein